MASAEAELYKVWKNLTLTGAESEATRYRIWDYPIKEQYTKMLATIDKTGPVKTAADGFQRVIDVENATFAFIHDAMQVLVRPLATSLGPMFAP